ncbi:MAG TPA: phosphatase PAP2 family protein [Patescibacteria group bacterium]|nr:phosphatase PAP2 family protein [Patescibacteria group bacterium]
MLSFCMGATGGYADVPDGPVSGPRGDSSATAADAPAGDERAAGRRELPGSAVTPPGESSLEVRIFRFLNRSLSNPVLDAMMPVFTDFKRSRVAVLVVWSLLVLFGGSRGRWAALMLIPLIAASDQISSHLLKPLVQRMRPCEVLGSVHLWHGPEGWLTTPAVVARSYKSSFSFPSGHAANITASMLFLGLVYRRWLVPLLAVAVAVSYSRIYIGVHWPSDALVGIALGGVLAWPAYLAHKSLSGKNATRPAPGTPPSG